MTSKLSDIHFGSPLPDLSQILGEEIIKGNIEVPNLLWEVHIQSSVQLRPMTDLDKALDNTINGTWTYTPKYLGPPMRQLRQAYSFGHSITNESPGAGYEELIAGMTRYAEQQFFYKPLAALRSHLIGGSGRLDKMPRQWFIEIGPSFTLSVAANALDMFLDPEQHKPAIDRLYELIADHGHNLYKDEDTFLLTVSDGRPAAHCNHPPFYDPSYVNMSNIFRFLLHPIRHGLTQMHLQKYLQNL